jgi:hypothetical protein
LLSIVWFAAKPLTRFAMAWPQPALADVGRVVPPSVSGPPLESAPEVEPELELALVLVFELELALGSGAPFVVLLFELPGAGLPLPSSVGTCMQAPPATPRVASTSATMGAAARFSKTKTKRLATNPGGACRRRRRADGAHTMSRHFSGEEGAFPTLVLGRLARLRRVTRGIG